MLLVLFGYSLTRQDLLWLRCSQFVVAAGVDNGAFVVVHSTSRVKWRAIEWEGLLAPKFERHRTTASRHAFWFRVSHWPTARMVWHAAPIWVFAVPCLGWTFYRLGFFRAMLGFPRFNR